MGNVPGLACHIWGTRDELTIEDGVLLKGNRICIPQNYMTGPSMSYMRVTRAQKR